MSRNRQPFRNVRPTVDRGRALDIHEILKKEIYRQGSDDGNMLSVYASSNPNVQSSSSATQLAVTSNTSQANFEDIFIFFDSQIKNGASDTVNGELIWSISSLNGNRDVTNVIAIQIESFTFPNIQIDDVHPLFFYNRKVYMQLVNAPSSYAISGQNSLKFHFEFFVSDINGTAVTLVPTRSSFYFSRPITSLAEFDVRFMVPTGFTTNGFRNINLPPDVIQVVSVNGNQFEIQGSYTTQQVFGPVIPAISPTPYPYTLTTPVAVWVNGFTGGTNVYNTGTAGTGGVPSTTVIGVGTTWTLDMVGGQIVFNTGDQANIVGFVSATQITIGSTLTVSAGTSYTIYYGSSSVINDANGIFVNTLQSDTRFTIQVFDSSTGTFIAGTFAPNLSATMVIPKNRIAFPVRFTCITNQPTNFITINHQ